jgi:putative transposase
MTLEQGNIYHVYNRGNNKQKIFFEVENYDYFLTGVGKYLSSVCDILAWCLMPNHFHFLVHANSESVKIIEDGSFKRQRFSQGIKQLLSSYSKAVNKRYHRTGSLFQQKTKALCVLDSESDYALTALHHIHQNPLRANIVQRMEGWDFSSFSNYVSKRDNTLCKVELCRELLGIDLDNFLVDSYQVINYQYAG